MGRADRIDQPREPTGRAVLMVVRLAPPEHSGAGRQAARLAAALREAGEDVELFAGHPGRGVQHDDVGGVPVTRWPVRGRSLRVQQLRFALGLVRFLRRSRGRFDVVHVHGTPAVLRVLRRFKRALGVGIVFKPTQLDKDDPRKVLGWYGRETVDAVDRWVAITDEIAASAQAASIPRGKVLATPNAVDTQHFRPPTAAEREQARARLGIAPGASLWVSVGSQIPRKGFDLLVEAWAALPQGRPTLMLVGPGPRPELPDGGPYAERLTRLAGELGPDVRLEGPVDDVRAVLWAADGFVFAPRQEGMPNVVLEALATGLTVVCGEFGGVAALRPLGGDRIRIVPRDAEALARAVRASPARDRSVPDGVRALSFEAAAQCYRRCYEQLRGAGGRDRRVAPRRAALAGRLTGRRRTLAKELAVVAALSAVPVLLASRVGATDMAFMTAIACALGFAAISPQLFAVVVLAVAPLPAIDAIVGVTLPTGADPLTLVVVVGVGLTLLHTPLNAPRSRLLTSLVLLNVGVLMIAWMRTYGQDAVTASSIALFLKPLIVVLAGLLVVRLLPRERWLTAIAYGMAAAMVLIALSVVLHRLGVYRTSYQAANEARLGFKQYGGVMGGGNIAGSFIAAFALPLYVLLRAAGHKALAVGLLVLLLPVLLITLSRGSIIGFVAALIALAVLDRDRLAGLKLAVFIFAVGAGWALTGGAAQTRQLVEQWTAGANDQNAQLSGRVDIWSTTFEYLDADSSRWVLGGGLDGVREFNESTSLGNAFATHSAYLQHLTNGGFIALAAYVALALALFVVAARAGGPFGLSLQLVVVATLVMGVASNFDLFSRQVAWVWVLAAAVAEAPLRERIRERARSRRAGVPAGRTPVPT